MWYVHVNVTGNMAISYLFLYQNIMIVLLTLTMKTMNVLGVIKLFVGV